MRKESSQAERDEYEALFLLLSARVERFLLRLLMLVGVLLLFAQGLLQVPAFRMRLAVVERLEGIPYQSGLPVVSGAAAVSEKSRIKTGT